MYLALFLMGILYLYVSRNKKRDLFSYSIFVTILVLFPVTRWVISKYFQDFYSVEALYWILPVLLVIAYVFMEVWSEQQEKRKKVFFIPIACLLIILCGRLSHSYEYVSTNIDEEMKEVYQMILEEASETDILLVAPRELMEHARQYDARLLTVYGRDLWENELDYVFYDQYEEWAYLLKEHIETPVVECRLELLKEINQSGANYVVFDKENLTFGSNMQYPEQYKNNEIALKQLGETRHYVIYYKSN